MELGDRTDYPEGAGPLPRRTPFSKDPRGSSALSRNNSFLALRSEPDFTPAFVNYNPSLDSFHPGFIHQGKNENFGAYPSNNNDIGRKTFSNNRPSNNAQTNPEQRSVPRGGLGNFPPGSSYKEAALVVHERVVIVTPRVLISSNPNFSPSGTPCTPSPSYAEAQDLVNLANRINPINSSLSQVTVTDEEAQSHVELDFSTPSPPSELDRFSSSNQEYVDYSPRYKRPLQYEERTSDTDTSSINSRPKSGAASRNSRESLDSRKSSPVSSQVSTKEQNITRPRSQNKHNQDQRSRTKENPRTEERQRSLSRERSALDQNHRTRSLERIYKQEDTFTDPTQVYIKEQSRRINSSGASRVVHQTQNSKHNLSRQESKGEKKEPNKGKLHRGQTFTQISAGSSDQGWRRNQEDIQVGNNSEMTMKKPSRDGSPDRPSWGFGNSRIPSRQEVGYDYNDSGPLYERSVSRNSKLPSRAPSRNALNESAGLSYDDITSSNTLQLNKKLSRQESRLSMISNITSRYKEELQNHRAMKITIYKNGDQWFEGFELRYKPAKDFLTLESLLAKISPRIDFTTSVAYLFDTDGNKILNLEDLEDGQSYVASNSRRFIAANYGRVGEAFWMEGSRTKHVRIVTRKSSGSSKSSSNDSKPGSGDGRVIKIINNDDTTVSERVLLNLRTSQPFEEVVSDLGQVLKVKGADRMYSLSGREVKSFSHFRHEFMDDEEFVITSGPAKINKLVYRLPRSGSLSRSRSQTSNKRTPRSRSLSVTRDMDAAGNFKILIKGSRKVYQAPLQLPPEDNSPPDHQLALEWVYGYRGADQARNLWVLEKGDLVYYIGAVFIIYNRMDEKQKHYRGHTEDVQCADLHPLQDIMVSGQKAGVVPDTEAHIRVWDLITLETLALLGIGECGLGISGVAFSTLNKGQFVSAVDESSDRILSIWDWPKDELIARVVTNTTKIYGLAFHPFDNNLIITHGVGHLCFWGRRKDSFFERVDVADKDSLQVSFTTIEFLESGDLVVGDSEGYISSYSVTNEGEYYQSFKFPAHEKAISCIFIMAEGTMLTGGEKDRFIKAWDTNADFEKITELELNISVGGPRTIAPQWPGRSDGNIYVGTVNNLILEGSLQRKFNMILFGHTSKLRGIATHPSDISFVSVGSDKTIANWRRSKLLWKVQVQTECLSVCYHPQGTVVVVGTADGNMLVLKTESGDLVSTTRLCGSPITAVKFCLDGDLVAAASSNGSIYIYKSSRDGFSYKKQSKLSGGQSLNYLDWDEDSEYMQTCTTDFNLNFWSTLTNKMEKTGSSLRDMIWVDQTCPVGWAVSGLWNNFKYESDVTLSSVNVNPSRSLTVSGDTDGFVRLLRYPILSPKAEFYEEKVVSGPIYSIRFFYDESYVVGVGGEEGAVFKWKIK